MPLGCQTKLQQKEQLLYIDLIPVKLRGPLLAQLKRAVVASLNN